MWPQTFWRKSEREEKQQKRVKDRQAQEQRRLDIELLEAKRQQRKLNFLITQTELYAHFMARKMAATTTSSSSSSDVSSSSEMWMKYDCEERKSWPLETNIGKKQRQSTFRQKKSELFLFRKPLSIQLSSLTRDKYMAEHKKGNSSQVNSRVSKN